jgi:hypothetical protein
VVTTFCLGQPRGQAQRLLVGLLFQVLSQRIGGRATRQPPRRPPAVSVLAAEGRMTVVRDWGAFVAER